MASEFSKLSPQKKKYVKARASGMTKKDAALAAGYAESTSLRVANNIETPDVRAAFAEIMRKAAPPEKIARRVAEGLDAMETKFFQSEGSVVETRDVVAWSERRQYAALAADLGGYFVPAKAMETNFNNIVGSLNIEIGIVKVEHGQGEN